MHKFSVKMFQRFFRSKPIVTLSKLQINRVTKSLKNVTQKSKDTLWPSSFLFGLTFYNKYGENFGYDENNKKSLQDLEKDVINKTYSADTPELVQLMDILKECIIESSTQYRECIKKQIEIIKLSSVTGFMNDNLDDLPEYRTMASDLHQELISYITLLRTVGEMTFQYLVTSSQTGCLTNVDIVSKKYKDLEVILQRQLDENRKYETELNDVNRDMILNTKLNHV